MNVLSLFAGIGGLDLGLERAGMTVVGQVELDPYCQRVLAKHWPEVPRHDDVRTCADWWRGRPRPPVHVVAGGFPCQPFSTAGKRLGTDDPRWLWPAFAQIICDLRPDWVLLENVPGLLGRGMGDVLGDLAACGYDTEWDCIPAAAVGAPHRRDRAFLVAYAQRPGVRHEPESLAGSSGAAFAVHDGAAQPVADADSPRLEERNSVRSHTRPELTTAVRSSPTLADTPGAERQPAQPQGVAPAGWPIPEPGKRDRGGRPDGHWWSTEPDVGRVAHGVPARVDRLRSLGNAVVPQVAEHIGRLIVNADGQVAA